MNEKRERIKLVRNPRPFVNPIPDCMVLRDFCSENLDERIQVEATVGIRWTGTECHRIKGAYHEIEVTYIRIEDVVKISGVPVAKCLNIRQGSRTAGLREGQRIRFCATCGIYRCGYEPDDRCSGLGYIGPVVILDYAQLASLAKVWICPPLPSSSVR